MHRKTKPRIHRSSNLSPTRHEGTPHKRRAAIRRMCCIWSSPIEHHEQRGDSRRAPAAQCQRQWNFGIIAKSSLPRSTCNTDGVRTQEPNTVQLVPGTLERHVAHSSSRVDAHRSWTQGESSIGATSQFAGACPMRCPCVPAKRSGEAS